MEALSAIIYMKNLYYLLFALFVFQLVPQLTAQENLTIRGTVVASDSKEPLVGAVVLDTLSKQYAITDGYGFFSIGLPFREACLFFQYVGYDGELRCETFDNGAVLNVMLTQANYLPQVEVSASIIDKSDGIGTVSLPIKTIQLLPQLGGEADLLKTIALMPGVALGVEGSTGLFIRGGSPDQNLILLDEAPVYNISHFGSFLSVFNTDAIKHFRVIKGGWPAQYGGRLSGLVDIHTREGNMSYWQGKMTVSPLLGRFMVEGPLVSQKTSFLLSGRSSWLGGLFNLLASDEISQKYLMYDLNAKLTHRFNEKNRIYVSYYSSLDDSQVKESIIGGGFGARPRLSSDSRTGVKWGNQTASIRYASFFKRRWSCQSILYYTKYRFSSYRRERNIFADGEETYASNTNTSSNRDIGAKALLSFNSNKVGMKAGIEWVHQLYQPQSAFVANNDSTALLSDAEALQMNYFWEWEFRPFDKWTAEIGVRYTRHNSMDTIYPFLEPRIQIGMTLSPKIQARLSANYGQQYIHLLAGGNTGLLNEIWLGSTARVPPQRGGQAALGIVWTAANSKYAIELEGFYKRMENLVEFKSVSAGTLEGLADWESLVETGGEGRVQGLEVLLRKQIGTLTGWLGYTLSKSERRFDALNRGNWFPFRFDRRHDVSLVLLYALGHKWNLSATWIYQTGSHITLPVAKIPNTYINEGGIVITGGTHINEKRNNITLPPYHRLDIGATYTWKSKKRGAPSSLGFSIYNAYNRINPYFIRTDSEPVFDSNGRYLGNSQPKVVVVGLFPFIPSVSFSRDFGVTHITK